MAEETQEVLSREEQRVERMKIQCNKLVDNIKRNSDDPKAAAWVERYAKLSADIERTTLRVAADEAEEKEKTEGVNIDIPLHKFGLRVTPPTE